MQMTFEEKWAMQVRFYSSKSVQSMLALQGMLIARLMAEVANRGAANEKLASNFSRVRVVGNSRGGGG
jgi:hypothetical protein